MHVDLPGSHLDQIGIVVPDLKSAMDGYIATMGVTFQVFDVDQKLGSFSGSSPAFETRFAIAQSGLSSVELIQPVSGDTIHSRFLQSHGPGMHHIGIYVPQLQKARQALERRGSRTVMEGQITGLGKFAYLESPDMHCIVELLELALTLPFFLAQHAKLYTGL